MKRITLAGLIAAGAMLLLTPAFGQQPAAPGPTVQGSLTVTVTGIAEAPADWVEVNLTAEGQGVNTQEALAVCRELCDAAETELVGLGIAEADIRVGPPGFATSLDAALMKAKQMAGGEQAQHVVRRSLTARLADINPETQYDDICIIIDTAAAEGVGLEAGEPWAPVKVSQGVVTFGVDDPKALRAKAIADGFAKARETADLAAAASGREVQAVIAVVVQDSADEGIMAMVNLAASAEPPSQATHRVMLTVTYAVE